MSAATHEVRLASTKLSLSTDEVHKRRPVHAPKLLLHAALVLAAPRLFVLALHLIKASATGLRPLVDGLSADGIAAGGRFWFSESRCYNC